MRKPFTIKARLRFQELKSVGLDLSHDAADLPVNRPKNRYTNILPCEWLTAKHHGMNLRDGPCKGTALTSLVFYVFLQMTSVA